MIVMHLTYLCFQKAYAASMSGRRPDQDFALSLRFLRGLVEVGTEVFRDRIEELFTRENLVETKQISVQMQLGAVAIARTD